MSFGVDTEELGELGRVMDLDALPPRDDLSVSSFRSGMLMER